MSLLKLVLQKVAPHTGAWIETSSYCRYDYYAIVAPHTGAWIETSIKTKRLLLSLVAPHTGAWIETATEQLGYGLAGRTPHGCVD